jgi:hypothetical protein
MVQRLGDDVIAPGGIKAFGSMHGYVQPSGLPAEPVELA